MAYTPKTWGTGDRVRTTDLNHIEQGIANAGSAMIATVSYSHEEAYPQGALNKTFAEIYNALKSGTPVYVKAGKETSGPSSDYACGMGLLPVLSAIKYDALYRVYVSDKCLGRLSGNYYAACPAVITFTASSPNDYPTSATCIIPSQVIDAWG